MTGESWVSRKVPKLGKVQVRKVSNNWYEPWVVVLPQYVIGKGTFHYSQHHFKDWSVAFQLAMDIQDSRNRP